MCCHSCNIRRLGLILAAPRFAPLRNFPPIQVELNEVVVFASENHPKFQCLRLPRWMAYYLTFFIIFILAIGEIMIHSANDVELERFQQAWSRAPDITYGVSNYQTREATIHNFTFHNTQVLFEGKVDVYGDPHGRALLTYPNGAVMTRIEFEHSRQKDSYVLLTNIPVNESDSAPQIHHREGMFTDEGSFTGKCSVGYQMHNGSTLVWYGNCVRNRLHGFGVEVLQPDLDYRNRRILRAGVWETDRFSHLSTVPTSGIPNFILPGKAQTLKANLLRVTSQNATGFENDVSIGTFVYYVGHINHLFEPDGPGEWFSSTTDTPYEGGTYLDGKLTSGFRVTTLAKSYLYSHIESKVETRYSGDFDAEGRPHGIIDVKQDSYTCSGCYRVLRMGMRHGKPCGFMWDIQSHRCGWNPCDDVDHAWSPRYDCDHCLTIFAWSFTWYSIYSQPWWGYTLLALVLSLCFVPCVALCFLRRIRCENCPSLTSSDTLCLAGELVTMHRENEVLLNRFPWQPLFHNLDETNEQHWRTQGINAKAPAAGRCLQEHVKYRGKPGYEDQFIRTTSDLEVARRFSGVFGALAAIRKPSHRFLDLTNNRNQFSAGFSESAKRLRKALTYETDLRTVLLHPDKGHIAPESIALLEPYNPDEQEDPSTWPPVTAIPNTLVQDVDWCRIHKAVPPLIIDEWEIKHRCVGRFQHVCHTESDSTSHYLSFCGTPDLGSQNSSPPELRLASAEELVAQCQSEVIATLLYRALLPPPPGGCLAISVPIATLQLCQIEHVVVHEPSWSSFTYAYFPARRTPLLLYEFSEKMKPWPMNPNQPLDLQLKSDLSPHSVVTHVRSSFRASLVVDALLGNTHIATDIFVIANGSGHRCGNHFVLGNRPDVEMPSVRQLLSKIIDHNPTLFEESDDQAALNFEILRQSKHILATCEAVLQPDHRVQDCQESLRLDLPSASPLPSATASCQITELLRVLDESRQTLDFREGSVQHMFIQRLRELQQLVDSIETDSNFRINDLLTFVPRHITIARPQRRIAFCITNDKYRHLPPLPAAAVDGQCMREALEKVGFETQIFSNLGRYDLRSQWKAEVLDVIQPNDLVVVYYSGHGLIERGEQFILPNDYQLVERQTPTQAGAVSIRVLIDSLHNRQREMAAQGAAAADSCSSSTRAPSKSQLFVVLVLDCCRMETNQIEKAISLSTSESSVISIMPEPIDNDSECKDALVHSIVARPLNSIVSRQSQEHQKGDSLGLATGSTHSAHVYIAAATLKGHAAYSPSVTTDHYHNSLGQCSYFTQAVLRALRRSDLPLHDMFSNVSTLLKNIYPDQTMWIEQTNSEELLHIYLGKAC